MSQTRLRPLSTPWTPHNYQKKAVKFLLELACAALFLDPGLGKTSIVLAALVFLKRRGLLGKVLIIAPLRVCHSVWPAEQAKWKDFKELKMVVLHGPHKDELLQEEADIYLINPEGLEWLLDIEKTKSSTGKVSVSLNLRRWKSLGFTRLVVDELTKFKNPQAHRFKALKLVLHTFSSRWGLTGSPAANGLMDLFAQCYVLDEGRALGKYITHYRTTYFNPSYDGFSWDLKEGADKQIYDRIKHMCLRMSATDFLELPKLIEVDLKVDLPQKAMEAYELLEDDLITKIDQGIITAATAAVASGKCRQLANGAIYLEPEIEALIKLPKAKGHREWAVVHDVKLDALEDLIEELQGHPVLIAYEFAHDLSRLQERLGKNLPYIGGGVTAKRSTELEQQWNNGDLRILAGHPAAMGHGLNLQGSGSHIIWFTPTWDQELYDQFIRRVYRQGTKAPAVFVYRIIAKGTVDEAVVASLRSKTKVQQALFDGLKKLRSSRK